MSKISISTGIGKPVDYDESQIVCLVEQGLIDRNALCWKVGMSDWSPIHKVMSFPDSDPKLVVAPPLPEDKMDTAILTEVAAVEPAADHAVLAESIEESGDETFWAKCKAVTSNIDFEVGSEIALLGIRVIAGIVALGGLIWFSITAELNFFIVLILAAIGFAVAYLAVHLAAFAFLLATGYFLFEGEFFIALKCFGGIFAAYLIQCILHFLATGDFDVNS